MLTRAQKEQVRAWLLYKIYGETAYGDIPVRPSCMDDKEAVKEMLSEPSYPESRDELIEMYTEWITPGSTSVLTECDLDHIHEAINESCIENGIDVRSAEQYDDDEENFNDMKKYAYITNLYHALNAIQIYGIDSDTIETMQFAISLVKNKLREFYKEEDEK